MSMIDNDWLPAIKEEYSKPYYKELFIRLYLMIYIIKKAYIIVV